MQIFKILFIFQKHFFIFFSSSLFLNGKQETLEDIADSIANSPCKSAVSKVLQLKLFQVKQKGSKNTLK